MKVHGILTYFVVCCISKFTISEHVISQGKGNPIPSDSIPIIDESSKASRPFDEHLKEHDHNKFASKISDFFSNDVAFGTIISSVIFLQALILFILGQPIISRSGKIKLWEGDIHGPENSQMIFDWYTFTHMLHGVIFYAVGGGALLFFPEANIGIRAIYILALCVEALWEAVENSPTVINRYRNTALANGYTGDSILNSVCDNVAMSIGFWLAYLTPPLIVLGIAVAEEIILAMLIRDNLTLNVIQLIYPMEAISKWQTAGSAAKTDTSDSSKPKQS